MRASAVSARLVTTFFFLGFGPVLFGTVVAQYALAATPLQDWLVVVGRTLRAGISLTLKHR